MKLNQDKILIVKKKKKCKQSLSREIICHYFAHLFPHPLLLL